MAPRAGIGAGGFGVNAKLAVHLREKLRGVPLVGMLLAGAEGVDEFARDVLGDAEHVVALVFAFERGAPYGVNRLALLVHHVVVFKEVLAGVEVLGFHGFLRVFDAAGDELGLDGHPFGHAQAVHEGFDALAAEDAHEIVFEGEEEARGAGVALTSSASTQLVVDAAGFVALGAENVQAAEGDDFIVLGFALIGELLVNGFPLIGGNLKNFALVLKKNHGHAGGLRAVTASAVGADHRGSGGIGHGELIFQEIFAGEEFRIAAEQNVGAAAGHVGGHGDGTFAPGLGDDAGFTLVLLGIEHLVRNARFFQVFGDGFGFFDGDGADQNGLAALVIVADAVGQRIVFLQDAVDHGFKLFLLGAVDDVRIFSANQRAIGGNHHDIEVVNLAKLGGFRFRGASHAGELLIHAEIVLEGDGREGLVFALDLYAFLGFDCLMQAVGPAAAGHLAPGEFIDDDDFAVFVDVVDVNFVERVRAQGLIDVVHGVDVGGVGHIGEAEQALAFVETFFGEGGLAVLFVDGVIDVFDQFGNDFVDLEIFVGGLFGGTGDDERGACFIDQDGVDFVDDAEVVAALHTVGEVVLHVVAEIVEAELVVGAVGDVGGVGGTALIVVEVVDDHADGEPERAIERTHPFRVAAGEVVVDGDDVHTASGQSVEGGGKGGDEGLAFAGLHFRDFAVVQDHPADKLHVEVAHVQEAASGFANQGECRNDGR